MSSVSTTEFTNESGGCAGAGAGAGAGTGTGTGAGAGAGAGAGVGGMVDPGAGAGRDASTRWGHRVEIGAPQLQAPTNRCRWMRYCGGGGRGEA